MASQIRISPDQMRERANSYQTESGNVSEMIGRLDSLLQSLLGEWEGSASEAYRERYESLRPAFTQAEELLAEISKALNTTAQKYGKCRRKYCKRIQRIVRKSRFKGSGG